MLTSQRPALRNRAFILIGGFLLAFLGALGTVFATWSSREVVLHEWEDRLSSVAQMLSAHAGQSIGAADLVLRGVTENIKDYGVRNDAEMHATFSSRPFFEMLTSAMQGLPQIDVISIVARDGAVLNFSREFPAPPINLGDRDYFRAHMEDPGLDVFLSQPVQNRGTGTWTFYLARKITSPSGETLGLIITGLHARFFADFYQSVGRDFSNISLFRTDGALLAQHAVEGATSPQGYVRPPLLASLGKSTTGHVLTAAPGTSLRAFEEMTAFDSNARLPVGVSVTASRQQVLMEWESEAIRFVFLGGAMSGLLIAVTIVLSRLISELETARHAALVAGEAKTRFASNVSHELRTPMNAIIGGSHQLMQTALTQESQRYAQIVASAAQQLMILINDILDFSYYEARNFRMENAPFDARELAHSTLDMARALVLDKPLDLSCDIADHVPTHMIGDAGRIKQVLLNLLSNAVKFTDHGSVRLRVAFHKGTEPSRDRLIFDIIDTGPGISAEDQARIFQPFERGNAHTQSAGTGLGLTISKKLIEAMSGKITLATKPRLGSCFSVILPATVAPDEPARFPAVPVTTQAAPHAKKLKILVAEDVAPNRVLLTMILQKMGHEVVAVENGLLAVMAAQAQAFDLILMDLQMPELDGRVATQRIRQGQGPSQAARILAVSANVDLDGANGPVLAGFDDTLLKPVTPARLDFVIAAIAASSS